VDLRVDDLHGVPPQRYYQATERLKGPPAVASACRFGSRNSNRLTVSLCLRTCVRDLPAAWRCRRRAVGPAGRLADSPFNETGEPGGMAKRLRQNFNLPHLCGNYNWLDYRTFDANNPSDFHMLLGVLALVALLPFALVGFLYREAHIDTRQALLFVAATVAVVAVLATLLMFDA
jgi:hypothetical protein